MFNYYMKQKRTTNIRVPAMNSVLKLRVCHFSYVTMVTEGVLIIFLPRKKRQGALIGAGALNGLNTVAIVSVH